MLTCYLLDEQVNTLYKEDIKVSYFLDLFQAGKSHAYLSVVDLYSVYKRPFLRIEMVIPNVGALRLYQTFIEIDEQIPEFKVFYTSADKPFVNTKITNASLLNRAVHIVWNCKKYCENNPKLEIPDFAIQDKINNNKKLITKLHSLFQAKYANTQNM